MGAQAEAALLAEQVNANAGGAFRDDVVVLLMRRL